MATSPMPPRPAQAWCSSSASSASSSASSSFASTSSCLSRPPPTAVSPSSLLLLSSSAQAAVLESKKFESGSRHSSTALSTPPIHPHLRSPIRHHSPLHHLHSHSLPSNLSFSCRIPSPKPDRISTHLFKCEKCPKVYRHPQCLVKHRWEHTAYWADASKLMLSKHQQVQMLEAAAILAAPSGSLPESRSLWPAAVSPSEAGLLGSDQVNLDIILSQACDGRSPALYHVTPSGQVSDIEVGQKAQTDEEEEEDDDDEQEEEENGANHDDENENDEDEIMFEMSLEGDDHTPMLSKPSTPSIDPRFMQPSMMVMANPHSLPPAMGYFEKRAHQKTKHGACGGPSPTGLFSGPTPGHGHPPQQVPAIIAYLPPISKSSCNTASSFGVYHPETIFKPVKPYVDSQLRFEGRQAGRMTGEKDGNPDGQDPEDEGIFGTDEHSDAEVIGMEL